MKRGEKVQFQDLQPGDVFGSLHGSPILKTEEDEGFNVVFLSGEKTDIDGLPQEVDVTFLDSISTLLPSFKPCTTQVELELVGSEEARHRGVYTDDTYFLFCQETLLGCGNDINSFDLVWCSVVTPLIAEFDAREAAEEAKQPKVKSHIKCRTCGEDLGEHSDYGENEKAFYTGEKSSSDGPYCEDCYRARLITLEQAKQPKYEVGQWVVDQNILLMAKIYRVNDDGTLGILVNGVPGNARHANYDPLNLRLATDKEIAQQPKYEVRQWVVVINENLPSFNKLLQIQSFGLGATSNMLDLINKGKSECACCLEDIRLAKPDEIAQAEKEIRDKKLCLEASKHYRDDILPIFQDWPTEENISTFFIQSGGSPCVLCKEYGQTSPAACKKTCPLALAGEWCHRGAWRSMFNAVDLIRAYKTKSEKLKHWLEAERAATYLYELLLHLGGKGRRPDRVKFELEEK